MNTECPPYHDPRSETAEGRAEIIAELDALAEAREEREAERKANTRQVDSWLPRSRRERFE